MTSHEVWELKSLLSPEELMPRLFVSDERYAKKEGNKMSRFRLTKNLGMILLGIWLIMTGLIPLLHLNFEGLSLIMAILAIVSGALIMLGR